MTDSVFNRHEKSIQEVLQYVSGSTLNISFLQQVNWTMKDRIMDPKHNGEKKYQSTAADWET